MKIGQSEDKCAKSVIVWVWIFGWREIDAKRLVMLLLVLAVKVVAEDVVGVKDWLLMRFGANVACVN